MKTNKLVLILLAIILGGIPVLAIIVDQQVKKQNQAKAAILQAEADDLLKRFDLGLSVSKPEYLSKCREAAELRGKSLFGKASSEDIEGIQRSAEALYDVHRSSYDTQKELDRIDRGGF